jgi:hypothetical protein
MIYANFNFIKWILHVIFFPHFYSLILFQFYCISWTLQRACDFINLFFLKKISLSLSLSYPNWPKFSGMDPYKSANDQNKKFELF